MIEIKKLVIREEEGIKKYLIQYTKDSVLQKFTIIPIDELNNGQGNVELKQAVITYIT